MTMKKKLFLLSLRIKRKLKNYLKKFFLREDLGQKFDFKLASWRRLFKCLRPNSLVLALSVPITLFGIYYLVAFFSISPKAVCLEALKFSFENDKACRGNCVLYRLENKTCLIEALKVKNDIQASPGVNDKNSFQSSSLEKKIFSYLKDENLDYNFRFELVNVIAQASSDGVVPNFLVAYLDGPLGDEKIKAEIFKAFDWELVAGEPLSYYLAIINSDSSLELRLAAALKISAYPEKSLAFKVKDLEILKEVIFKPQTPAYLRQSLVLLLGDYRHYFPEESSLLLAEIERTNFRTDNISRAFAADFIGLPLPEISQEEWNRYYNR